MTPSFPAPHYHEGHAWGSPHAVWAEASTPQTTSFPGRLTEVRVPETTTQRHLHLPAGRLTLGLTVADRWEFTSSNWAFSPVPFGSQPHEHEFPLQDLLYTGGGGGSNCSLPLTKTCQGTCNSGQLQNTHHMCNRFQLPHIPKFRRRRTP